MTGLFTLSEDGSAEIALLIEKVRKTIHLAQNALWSRNASVARQLVEHKQHVSQLEEASRRQHLNRVRGGNLTSLSSSNQHLEMIAALKSVNSKLATIGYSILAESGGLKKTRLKKV